MKKETKIGCGLSFGIMMLNILVTISFPFLMFFLTMFHDGEQVVAIISLIIYILIILLAIYSLVRSIKRMKELRNAEPSYKRDHFVDNADIESDKETRIFQEHNEDKSRWSDVDEKRRDATKF